MHDVYAYGVIAPSTLVELEGAFPKEAGYAEVAHVRRSLGGEAAGGAHVLARLGIETMLAGSELGVDDGSQWVIDRLSEVGVDCRRIARVPGREVTEIVVSSGSERTIFATYGRMLGERAWSAPRRVDIQSCRVVCLDPFFGEESERVAEWCIADRIPYVTIDSLPDSLIASGAEVLVVSEEFSRREIGEVEPDVLLEAYVGSCPGLIILTRGGGPVWYRRRETDARSLAAFDVDVRDTTGAGDAFRAGVILALLGGGADRELVRTGSAVAAMVCQVSPGVIRSPTFDELSAFIRAH